MSAKRRMAVMRAGGGDWRPARVSRASRCGTVRHLRPYPGTHPRGAEDGCGVTLLDDCEHGCDIKGNVMRPSLLRGTTDPDVKTTGLEEVAAADFREGVLRFDLRPW